MKEIKYRLLRIILVFVLGAGVGFAQDAAPPSSFRSAPVVTAGRSSEGLRFTAPSTVVQMHLQVYDSLGQLLSAVKTDGNVLDWNLQDSAGQRLINGSYLAVVTAKDLSGRLSRRLGSLSIAENQIELQPVEATQLTPAQQQAVGQIEENEAVSILKPAEGEAVTLVAHNGEEGQITRGRGALSFRIGDFFSGKDTEQMRLTPEGNLGIGITHPLVRLDVDGLVRASQGIVFPDGSIQYSAATKTYGAKSSLPDPSFQSLQSRSGKSGKKSSGGQEHIETISANMIAKFQDGGGTLTNSSIFDNGTIGIGTTTPDSLINIQGAIPTLLGHMVAIRTTGSNNGPGLLMDATGSGNNNLSLSVNGSLKGGFSWDNARNFIGFVNFVYSPNDFALRINSDGSLTYHDGATSAERFRITKDGNVGIGTANPTTATGGRVLNIAGPSSAVRLDATDPGGQSWEWQSTIINGQGAMNLSNPSIGINPMTVLANGNVGVGTIGPAATLHVIGQSQPPATSGSGADAPPVLQIIGGAGGNTNSTSSSSVAGAGADVLIRAGNGGNGNDALSFAGRGGSITLQPGNSGSPGFTRPAGNILLMPTLPFGFGGNVGIGTPVPSFRLHVHDSRNTGLRVETDAPGGQVASFGVNGDFQIDAPGVGGGRLVVKEGGSVGIGTAAPLTSVHVRKDSLGALGPVLTLMNGAGGSGSGAAIDFDGYDTGANDPTARIKSVDAGNSSSDLVFMNKVPGAATLPVVEHMRITSSGNVGIGTNNPGATLEVRVNGTTLADAWTTRSSARFKTNVQTISAALDKVLALRGVTFDWKGTGRHSVGFIAEEVGRVLPEAVEYEENGRDARGLDYSKLTPLLVEAVKEQQAEIKQQQQQIDTQQKQIEQLTREVRQMRAVRHRARVRS